MSRRINSYIIVPILFGGVLFGTIGYFIKEMFFTPRMINLQGPNDMHAISVAANQFLILRPDEELTLQALTTPSPDGKFSAFMSEVPRDPWGNDYELATNAEKIFITSLGSDGEANTEDDIIMSFKKQNPTSNSSPKRPTPEVGTTIIYPLGGTDLTSHKSISLVRKAGFCFISCTPDLQKKISSVYCYLIDKYGNSIGDVKLVAEQSTGSPSGIIYGISLNKDSLTERSHFKIYLKDNSTYQVHFHPLEYDFACYETITQYFDNDQFLCESSGLETREENNHTFEIEFKYTYVSKDDVPLRDPASFWKVHQNRLELSLAHYLDKQSTKVHLHEEWTSLNLKQGQVCYISTHIDPFGSLIIRIRNTAPPAQVKTVQPQR